MKEKQSLTIMDGFQFGCGFFIASLVYTVVMFVVMFVIFSVFGVGLLGAMSGL